MVTRKLGNTVEVDIHGLTELDAKGSWNNFSPGRTHPSRKWL